MKRLPVKDVIFLCLAVVVSIQSVHAEPDVLRRLLKSLEFAETNKARLEFDCRENPIYKSNQRLVLLCSKGGRIPDYVIEDAALPYLKKYVSAKMAAQAIEILQTDIQRALSNKLIQEIVSGKQDRLTAEDIRLLRQRNESIYGQALSSFASDKEQGSAVARAMLNYEL